MTLSNHAFILATRPSGEPSEKNFKLIEIGIPSIQNNQVLIKARYISVDPYMRGKMNDIKSYTEPYKLNDPVTGDIIGEVIESKVSSLKKGDMVHGILPWQQYSIAQPKDLIKLDTNIEPITAYLGALGMTGLTAYFGLLDIGMPDIGETVVISGAAGAVGSVAGQIAKIVGCKVIGITGSDEKVDYLKQKLHFDDAINYKSVSNIRKTIAKICHKGIDIYFDNVGGEISDSILYLIKDFARIIICGQISSYNQNRITTGLRPQSILLMRRASMKGFIVFDYIKHYQNALDLLKKWYKEGKLIHNETIINGFENLPQAFLGLFKGINMGKMLVRV